MEAQIRRRIREIDEALNEELTEFPAFLKNEIGEGSLSFVGDESRDAELLQRNIETLFKYPNMHLVSEVETKVKKVLEETQASARHCDNICKAIQRDMKKKTQIEQMIKLAEYIKTLKELEEMFESGQFLDDLDKLAVDQPYELNKQIDEFVRVDKFKKVKEIEKEESELIKLADVARPLNLENKGCEVLHEKVKDRLKSKFQNLKNSYDTKVVAISDAWISLIKYCITEFFLTGTKIFRMFSIESCIKFKGFFLNTLADYEATILDDYKLENKIEQMTIFSNSESIAEDKLKKLDHLCEDICSISHYSQSFLFVLSFTGNMFTKNEQNSNIKMQKEETTKDVKLGETRHNHLLQELIGSYITFEKPLLQNRVKGILQNDTKSILDDIKQKYDKEVVIQRDISDEIFYVYRE